MSKNLQLNPSLTALMSLALSFACSRREIDLGGERLTADLRVSSRCAESATLEGDVQVTHQGELEALAGCEEITGRLGIEIFEGADLSPLASLRIVGDALELGAQPLVFPEDPDEQEAFWSHIESVKAAGYLSSLDGLAALESVPTLYVTGSSVRDFVELSSLVDIDAVVFREMPSLETLAGLESATLSTVWINTAPVLESLDGLVLEATPETVILEWLPALRNADALAGLELVSSGMIFYGTGLEALPAFGNLQYITNLNIELNPSLTDISSIGSLVGAESLIIAGNPSLLALPAFDLLGTLEMLRVNDNDALEEVSLNFPALLPVQNTLTDRDIELSAILIEVSLNDALLRIVPPQSFTAVQYFSVSQNPSLTEVHLDQLRRVDVLIIDQNTSLATFSAPSLATVDSLEVLDNPALSPAVFDSVQTFARQISGNADAALP